MTVFILLVTKLLALYFLIALGFIAGRLLNVQKETIASLLIYVLAPLVVFYGVWTAGLQWNILALPLLFYVICILLCLVMTRVGKFLWKDATANLFGFTAATGNTGYFGIPVALTLFGERAVAIISVAILAFGLYENTLGFYTVARGHFSSEESLKRVIRLPTVYRFILGIIVAASGYQACSGIVDLATSVRGAYTVLGMMLIGLGMAGIKSFRMDWKFLAATFFAKFIVWPLVTGVIILFDLKYLHFFDSDIHKVMFLLSVVPMAANTVALATELKAEPEKAATAVLLSTLFALGFIPVMTMLFL